MSVKMPMQPVETPIVLSIYSDGWGNLLETRAIPEGQPVTVEIAEEFPYFNPAQYYAYARRDNCYTELYNCTSGQVFSVNLEEIATIPLTMTGVIFAQESFFNDRYVANQLINVTGPSGPLPDITTDEYGRYSITHFSLGAYTLDFSYHEVPFSFQITNSSGIDYQDLFFHEPVPVPAPNIYLYPETETNVTVTLEFPSGKLTISDPPYNDGWCVSVDTNGIIDGQYGYLFYEASVPMELDAKEGWLLDGSNLEDEFRELMAELGFQGREIDDFMEFWMPLMEGSPWYAVYLQDPEVVSILNISPTPQKLLRCIFSVRPLQQPIQIPQPIIVPFTRSGFTVVEWGVSGWGQ